MSTSTDAPAELIAVEQIERQRWHRSATIVQDYHWMVLRHLHHELGGRCGDAGLAALAEGIRRYGYHRGETLRKLPVLVRAGVNATSIVRHWQTSDLPLSVDAGHLHLAGSPSQVAMTFDAVPGWDYLQKHDALDALPLYWSNLLQGIADGFDDRADVEVGSIDPAQPQPRPWRVTWTFDGVSEIPETVEPPDILADPDSSTEANRRTFGALAAMHMYVSLAVREELDATGEEAIRRAIYAFGAERGSAARERHLAIGKPIGIDSLITDSDSAERDPYGALFVMRGEGRLSPGLTHADCIYCPLAEVWAERGAEGLALGYLWDMEVHRGLFESYHPGSVVKWTALKTRGDTMCKFRFTIPELMTDDDRAYLRENP